MDDWEDVERLLVVNAELDLRADGDIRPTLAVFGGGVPLLLAGCRGFPPGRYHQPLMELLALAGALGADRLALSMPGRAWSLDDPVPPVLDGVGDLRQRVLPVLHVDGRDRTEPRCGSSVYPFDLTDDGLLWHERHVMGPPEGWIPGTMEIVVREREKLRSGTDAIHDQLRRCFARGHELVVLQGFVERAGASAGRA